MEHGEEETPYVDLFANFKGKNKIKIKSDYKIWSAFELGFLCFTSHEKNREY